MPMAIETVAALMACSKLGAIWVPIFSGFGPDAVAARLADAGAKVLITADGSLRRGHPVPMKEIADRAANDVVSVEHVVVWERLGDHASPRTAWRDIRWEDLLAAQPGHFDTEALDSEHPLFIGYTSGTTGTPKGVLHVHAGFLVKIAEEVAYQVDVRPGDVLHWVTDLGWIMGPWEIVGALALGATVVLTEGAPNFPGPDRLWATVERHGVTTLGVSPTLIRALIPSGTEPVRMHDLSSLRILGVDRRAVEPRALPVAAGGGRRGPVPDHQPVGRHRGGRVLPLTVADHGAEAVHAARTRAGDGRRRLGTRRDAGPARARWASSSASSRGPP